MYPIYTTNGVTKLKTFKSATEAAVKRNRSSVCVFQSWEIYNNSVIIHVLTSDVNVFPALQHTDIVQFFIFNTNINRYNICGHWKTQWNLYRKYSIVFFKLQDL